MPSKEEEWAFLSSPEEIPDSAYTLRDPDDARDADAERIDGPPINRFFEDRQYVIGSLPDTDDEDAGSEGAHFTLDEAKDAEVFIKCEHPWANEP